MPPAIPLGNGLRHRFPLSAAGATTNITKAAALSQIPRLNSTVFLNEMAFTADALSAGLEYLLPLRIGALRIVQVGAE